MYFFYSDHKDNAKNRIFRHKGYKNVLKLRYIVRFFLIFFVE